MRTEGLIILCLVLTLLGGVYSAQDNKINKKISNNKSMKISGSTEKINAFSHNDTSSSFPVRKPKGRKKSTDSRSDYVESSIKPNVYNLNSMETTSQEIATVEQETTTIEDLTTTIKFETTTNESEVTTVPETTNEPEITTEPETTTIEPETTTTEEPVCLLLNTSHKIEEKRITVEWSINSAELCNNRLVIINITNESCLDNCKEPNCSCSVSSRNINASTLFYTLTTDIVPCSKYYHTIKIVSSVQEALKSNTSDSPVMYKEVKNVNIIDSVDHDNHSVLNMLVTWDYDYPQCNSTFQIIVAGQIYNKEIQFNGSPPYSITFENLTACDNFTITIYPKKDYEVTKYFTMRTILPTPIKAENFILSEPSAYIQLDFPVPLYGEKCIERYIAVIENDYENIRYEDVTSLRVISDIYACVNYKISLRYCLFHKVPNKATNFSVEPPTDVCSSDRFYYASDEKTIKTVPKPFGQPQQPEYINSSDTSLTLKVLPAEEARNKCNITSYNIQCESAIGIVHRGNNTNEIVVIEDLLPYNNYSCNASIENENRTESPWSSSRPFATKEGVPNAPIVNYTAVSSTSFIIQWNKPSHPKGLIRQYHVFILFSKFMYDNPPYCMNGGPNKTEIIVANDSVSTFEYEFNEAKSDARYYVQVQAQNGATSGDMSKTITILTLAGPPDEVKNFTIIPNVVEVHKPYNKKITLKFNYPCQANANITGFNISFGSEFSKNIQYKSDTDVDRYSFSYSTDDLRPDNEYSISIYAITDNEEIIGRAYTETFSLIPGIPVVNNEILNSITAETSTNAFYITIPPDLFKSEVGRILQVKILLGGWYCQDLEPRSDFSFNHNKTVLHTYQEAMEQDCISLYDTGIILHEKKDANHKEGIGTEIICESSRICNGPLRPGTSYGLTFRIFTKTGFSDTDYKIIYTNKQIPIITISIIILTTLCVVFLVGFYISWRRTKALRQSAVDSPYDRRDISVQNYHAYYSTMIKNDNEKIKEEYKAIQFFSENLDKTFIASKANEKMNRYLNIYPYDANRVVLNDDEFENDYINASYINGYYYPKEYIAAQGPKLNTVGDFWRMIIQHKVESIVMLTSLVENNKVKCHEYFPKLNGRVKHNNIHIHCIEEQKLTNYIKRTFTVEKNDVKLTTKHYYFCKWPDHGCPNNALDLIEFVKVVRNERHRPGETFVVHCSAGVGRTGTFIALDIMMQRIKKENRINIFDLVKQLRIQRMKMVQSCDQYVFLYTATLELITMPRNVNVLKNFRNTIMKYVNEFEVPKNLKLRERRKEEQSRASRTDDKETVL